MGQSVKRTDKAGCFRQFLKNFGHVASAACPECAEVVESAEHVLFVCPRFEGVRNGMMATTPDIWNAAVVATSQIVIEL